MAKTIEMLRFLLDCRQSGVFRLCQVKIGYTCRRFK